MTAKLKWNIGKYVARNTIMHATDGKYVYMIVVNGGEYITVVANSAGVVKYSTTHDCLRAAEEFLDDYSTVLSNN